MIPVIGIQIGQKRDRTAIAVAEMEYRPINAPRTRRRRKEHYVVRHLERLDPGTRYSVIAQRLAEVSTGVVKKGQLKPRKPRKPIIFAAAIGGGEPVIDLLKDEVRDARIWAVEFNHGNGRTEDRERRVIRLGKAYLVSRLQTLLEQRQLHLPHTPEADTLASELLEYEIRVSPNAHELLGAFRVGSQDDLVTAVGLAVHKKPSVSVYGNRASE